MIIQNNLSGINANNSMNKTQNSISRGIEKLSSGFSINRTTDNSSGLVGLRRIHSRQTGLSAPYSGTQDAVSLLQTANGAVNKISDMLDRMDELAARSLSGTTDDSQRAVLQKEVSSLSQEIGSVIQNTDFNGQDLFSGAQADFQIADTPVQIVPITLTDISVPTVDISTVSGAKVAIGIISAAKHSLSDIRSGLSAVEEKLSPAMTAINITNENLIAAGSRIGDINVAKEMTSLLKDTMLKQASATVELQANAVPAMVLQLLR